MKKYYFFWLLICVPLFGGAQTYGNEWINYAQKYYKIKVAKDGIYRVDSTTLAKAGIPLGSIDPRNFQLFFRGKEQYIYIQSGAVFNKNSYIEFYGQHNDGWLDTVLYPGGKTTPNPYYSLYNDTSTYYLTWNSSVSNHRMAQLNNVAFPSNGATYFLAQTVSYGSQEYYGGRRYLIDGLTASDPRYTGAEGWFNYELDLGQTQTYNLNINNVYTSGPSAMVKTLFAGESDAGLNPDHHIQVNASWNVGPPLTDVKLIDTFPVITEQYYVAASNPSFRSPVSLTYSSINDISGVPSNITAISYIYAQYPHTPNMGGCGNFMLYVPDTSIGTTYLDLSNVGIVNATDTVRFYDLTNHKRIKVVQNTFDTCKVLIPNGGGLKQCYLTSDDSVYKVGQLVPAGVGGTFTDYTPVSRTGIPYIIVSSPVLGLTVGGAAYNYANHRASTGYNVVLANVEELYDQYAYGIEKNPLAIRRFCDYALHKWRTPPQYLFLLGKGIHAPLFRPDTARYGYADDLVPSMGYPSSDVLLTAGLTGGSVIKPALATGRLAATNQAEVYTYLGKVGTYETMAPEQWQKKVVHFGGGADAAEQATILGYLNNYKSIIQSPYYGGDVYTFLKTTAAPIQLTLADSVAQLINNGVSIMTFFGHASGANFDINLDAPSNYNNVGKFPLIIANACFSGDIFQPEGAAISSTSEQFVLDQKGSIGFIATDDLGIENYLDIYTQNIYTDIANKMYRKPIGLCLQNTVSTAIGSDPNDLYMVMTCLEMTLHGDPAIALMARDSLPDYAVTDSSIYFSPSNVTTQVDSFKVVVVVSNLAEAVNQPVQLSVTRTFPNGTTANYLKTFTHVYYQDTVSITMPVNNISGVGLNQFNVIVDPSNLNKELTKVNNQLLRPVLLWITSGDIVPVYPYQFAIIPNDTVTLKASTGDPNAPLRKYIFQIDTSGQFNSPWLKSQVVSSKGGVVCAGSQYWVNTPPIVSKGGGGGGNSNSHMRVDRLKGPQLILTDSTVYYWRVMRDTNDPKDFFWENSSFQYIRGKTGWGQSNYFQFVNNQYNYIIPKPANRNWVFSPVGRTLQCFDYGVPLSKISDYYTQLYATRYVMDLNIEAYGGCQSLPGLMVAVIDPVTLQPWSNSNHYFNNMNDVGNPYSCHVPDYKFIFWYNDNTQMAGLHTMLNAIPNNDYILVYSWLQAGFQHWADSALVKNDFKTLDPLLNLTGKVDTVPWVFFVQKGNPATAHSYIGIKSTDSVQLNTTLSSNNDFGTMTTPVIGPAQKWDSISWRQHMSNVKDSVRINVIGLDAYYNPKTLMTGITPSMANLYISSINAKVYPYLQLTLYTKDTINHIPSQMKKWQVFYTPVPEVAVNPSIYSYFLSDSLQAGDSLNYKTVVQNISPYTMDSMLYNTWIVDAGNAIHNLPVHYTKKLKPGDTTMLSVKIPTVNYPGNNSIWFNVNPQFLPQTRAEEYYFNNFARENFHVIGDKTNPLLDVTFNGIHIMNNDIVSPHPSILIEVMDENKYLALNDTSDFAVYIRNVNNQVSQKVSFGPQMTFTPAVLPKNSCKILYTPSLADGTYELSVQAKDRSSNLSGTNNYVIDFQVINKSMISSILNYPNPFTTSTRFVFTLTGEQVPTYFKIQIITVTGKLVKEITEGEIGPIHIGTNITEYAWDGTDRFGDRLANGVYLYRVVTSVDGQSIDHYNTDADQYFTKGWGKMYLLR